MTWLSDAAVARLSSAARWPGFESDRYRVTHEIGRGGMGTVYAAIDQTLGREVAIKVSNAVASQAAEQRLVSEAQVLARLEHHGIVPVHDVGRLEDGRLFYVMRRVEGRTLNRHLTTATSLDERLGLFERVCETVAFAHARGVLHRDLKPDNIMVGAFGEVLVMDWGVAQALTEARAAMPHSVAGAVIGTHGFMAPEQARGDAALDQRSDIYALGAILFVVLTGATEASDAREIGTSRPPQWRAVPAPLQSIAVRALASRPEDRYPSAQALADDIARYRSGRAVLVHREGVAERGRRIARTYRTPILLVLSYMVMRAAVAILSGF